MMDQNKKEIKVNFHLLEPCNYRCKHCFAHFNNHHLLGLDDWKKIADNCCRNKAVKAINIAGGEPLLYPKLRELAEYIYNKGIKLSIITNGSLMTDQWIRENASYYETIGFSIDSFREETLIKMGRVASGGLLVSKEKFMHMCKLIRKVNPDCKIKMNTVVTALNLQEVMSEELSSSGIHVDRWKIFKMDIFKNECFDNSAISITDQEYEGYIQRNLEALHSVTYISGMCGGQLYISESGMQVVAEKRVTSAYIMIDANGCLVDDSQNTSYVKICNCMEEDFTEGLSRLNFDRELYELRYQIA